MTAIQRNVLFFTAIAIFVALFLVTLAGITGVVSVGAGYLRTLFGLTVVELAGIVLGWIKRDDLFAASFDLDLTRYKPNREAKRLLATFHYYQQQQGFGFNPGASRWVARLPADQHAIPQFYRAVAELYAVGIVGVQPADNHVYLTNEGLQYANDHDAELATNSRFLY